MSVTSQDLDFQWHGRFQRVLKGFRRRMVIRFADIGGIVGHHCLNFLFVNRINEIYVIAAV